jgi:hypothetical protein
MPTLAHPGSGLSDRARGVRPFLMKYQRLGPASGLARHPAGLGREAQGNPRLGPRTGLARCPREVGRAAAAPARAAALPAAVAASPATAPPAPRAASSAAPRSSPGCAPATTPASSSDARPGTPATSRRAAARRRGDQAGTTDDRPGKVAGDASADRRAARLAAVHTLRSASIANPPASRSTRSPSVEGVDHFSRAEAGQFSRALKSG